MKISIDARLYGLEHAGLGRYTMKLVDELAKLDKRNTYYVFLRKDYFNRLKLPKNWIKIKTEFKHYGWEEQIKLPMIIARLNPDLVHFPHFNVPVICSKPYVVTIHDLLMHKQKGVEATTLPIWKYCFKRLGYRLVFDWAVKKSTHIIVPSQSVARELTSFYKLPAKKITVTYEGV